MTEDWSSRKWRPYMAWMYMIICAFDFVIFPVLWSILQSHWNGQVTSQWDPLTLKGAGLFHMAMGAVIGVTAYGRTQEKINANNLLSTSSFSPPTPMPPSPINTNLQPIDPPFRNTRNDL